AATIHASSWADGPTAESTARPTARARVETSAASPRTPATTTPVFASSVRIVKNVFATSTWSIRISALPADGAGSAPSGWGSGGPPYRSRTVDGLGQGR